MDTEKIIDVNPEDVEEIKTKNRNNKGNSYKNSSYGNVPPKKSLEKGIIAAVVAIAVFAIISNSFYTVKETESAVVTTFGKAELSAEKGLHFKIPFIQNVTKVDTTVRGIQIGYSEDGSGNVYSVEHESIMITSDFNFIDCDFFISYQVTDPIKYLYNSDEPDFILKNIAMSSIRSTLSAYNVDTAITTGKAEIQSNVKTMIINELEDEDIGITLVDASIQDVEPPTDFVIEAFTAVETAKQGKESAINEANTYRNEQIPAAEASADRILQEAEATKKARINEATGQAARFNKEYDEYKNYPLITKQRMFYETMGDVLPNLTIYIESGDGEINKYLPISGAINGKTSGAVLDDISDVPEEY